MRYDYALRGNEDLFCPVCFEAMVPSIRTFLCGAGHLVCGSCRPQLQVVQVLASVNDFPDKLFIFLLILIFTRIYFPIPGSLVDAAFPLHNVQFVKYDVTVSFMAQVLDTVTYLVPQVLDTAS